MLQVAIGVGHLYISLLIFRKYEKKLSSNKFFPKKPQRIFLRLLLFSFNPNVLLNFPYNGILVKKTK